MPLILTLCCASLLSRVRLSATPGLEPTRLLCPRGFSRQEYESGLPCPPPGDLPNPGMEPRPPALQADSHLRHQGSPRILEWVAYPFSRASSQPRNQTGFPALQAELTPLLLLSGLSRVRLCAIPQMAAMSQHSSATCIYSRMCKPVLQEHQSKQQNRKNKHTAV